MKIRNGFVSNSSSSSFVILVKPEDHAKALSQCNEFVKDVLSHLRWNKKKVFGQEVLFMMDEFSTEDGFYFAEEVEVPDEYEDSSVDDLIAEYEQELKNIGAEYFLESDGH